MVEFLIISKAYLPENFVTHATLRYEKSRLKENNLFEILIFNFVKTSHFLDSHIIIIIVIV